MKRSYYVYVLLCVVAHIHLNGQHLARKGYLGIYPSDFKKDSLSTGISQNIRGAQVQQLLTGATAENAGVQIHDIVVCLNGTAIQNAADLKEFSQRLRGGDSIHFTLFRENRFEVLKGIVQSRPFENTVGSRVDYTEVPFDGGYLRSIVHIPKGKGPFPAVYYIQGYPCSSVEYPNDNHPFKKLTDFWVRHGFIVYKVEKPGMGDSVNREPCDQISFGKESEAFKAGYQQLLNLREVDTSKVFIYGHSLGGTHAPLLVEIFQPSGIMVYGVSGHSWYDYMSKLIIQQLPLFGISYADAESLLKNNRQALFDFFIAKKTPFEIVQNQPDARDLFTHILKYDGRDHLFGRHYQFWQDLNSQNIAQNWSAVACPVLAMYGETDIEALDASGANRIVRIVNNNHPDKGTFRIIKGTDHALIQTGSKKNGVQHKKEGTYRKIVIEQFNQEYPEILLNWMQSVLDDIK